ncbi:MAG: hypothetical protein H7327_08730 [Herminiimonas sp.]|nr:hypothetical protein [Herminiimonas sp.]
MSRCTFVDGGTAFNDARLKSTETVLSDQPTPVIHSGATGTSFPIHQLLVSMTR